MKWIPTTATKKIVKLTKRLKAVYGGASAGKTFSIIPILIDRAIKNKGEVITIISDTMPNLKGGAMRDFKMIMQSLDRWERDRWKETFSRYEFRNGSIIEFIGANEPDRFRGPRRDRLYINEANRVDYETFKQLNQRTRKEVWMDWNPTSPFWYYTEILENIEHDHLKLTYLDNETLSPEEVKIFDQMKFLAEKPDAKEYDKNYWKVYGLGEVGQVSGACIKNYRVVDAIPDGFRLLGVGLDFGKVDPNAAVALYKGEDNSYVFDELVYKKNQDTEDLYKELKDYDTYFYADYAWPDTIAWLKKLGLVNIRKCKKGPDSIKYGIDLLNEKDINVTKRSENLITEFNSYRYKEDKDGNLMEGKYEGPDHLVDACRYVLTKTSKKRQIKVY